MAKGVEDCAFYRYSRLTSLNEVGGDPSIFAINPADFHAAMAERQRDWPRRDDHHDDARHQAQRGHPGPDLRAGRGARRLVRSALDRLLALVPAARPRLRRRCCGRPSSARGRRSRERLHQYAEKAMREAGDHTTWTDQDAAYEGAVHAAVDAAFDSAEVRAVVDGLVAVLDEPGRSNGLATKLLALTVPGVPDVYQGTELWDHSLADPDNRRPVDYDDRVALLADGGHPKLRVTAAALRLRRDRPELFTTYAAVSASGPAADHALAFDRGGAVTVVTRLPVGLETPRRLGRHDAGARRRLARRADRPGREQPTRRRAARPARRAAGEGGLDDRVDPQISVRRVGSACAAGPAVGGRCHRRDDARGRRLVGPRRSRSPTSARRSTTAT